MEKIATSTYSFEKLRKAGYVYVDKTDLLWRLVSETEDSQFFISRPRRFGKSLYRIYAKLPPEWRLRGEADVKRHFRLFMEMLGAKVAAAEGSAFGYADAYKGDKRPVTLVGINFRTTKRNIDEPLFAAL